jgi:5'-nucleotidase
MRILITNDDGIHAEGVHLLAKLAKSLGQVKVVCPDRERSCCGHAMTLVSPAKLLDMEAYVVNGVPVDCINVGLKLCWPEGCDLVLSGINHGPNLGFDITYSGTVAGAMEGAINGIKSISISLANFVAEAPLHWETAEAWLTENLASIAALETPPLTFWNVNIPSVAEPELNGYRFAEMGRRVYVERVEKRDDPWGRPYYWQGGAVVMTANQPGTDVEAVSQAKVSITPLSLNWTHQQVLQSVKF